MDPRYQHPQVTELWSAEWTYDAWWRIEQAVIRAQRELGLVDRDDTEAFETMPTGRMPKFDAYGRAAIAEYEDRMQHDVAAFVAYLRGWWGEPHARWIHFGLTSSDLVDTAQGMRFRALHATLEPALAELEAAVGAWAKDETVVVGRTHGEPAEPISMGMRAAHWRELIHRSGLDLSRATCAMQVAKLSGPVGNFAHNPPQVEDIVATSLRLRPQGVGASQIVPRGPLTQWAHAAHRLAEACAKVAHDIRLMLLLGEAREERPAGQVGSSSMAHKTNPIRAEQIGGLRRLAAGYASMLQPLDLWLERDISNSSAERVAVPDLWHVMFHIIEQTTLLLRSIRLMGPIEQGMVLSHHANELFTHHVTLGAIRDGMDAQQAREIALAHDVESYDIEGEMRRVFLSNYPKDDHDRA